jgi:MSHA biogenesis protein MshM
MYLDHFGMRELPFTLTPNRKFFFNDGEHREALNVLLVALKSGEGFIKITGEVGTGKTLLCAKLMSLLGPQFVTAYVPNPLTTPTGLLCSLEEELGCGVENAHGADVLGHIASSLFLSRLGGAARQTSRPDPHRAGAQLVTDGLHAGLGEITGGYPPFKRITARVRELHDAGKKVVLLLDEAQSLPLASLETLRLLTNLETDTSKLIQIVLFGQPELDILLAQPVVRQLRQRITFSYTLPSLDRSRLERYVAYRLGIAGCRRRSVFTPRALRALTRGSRGIPRLVNILGHKALLSAYGRGDHRVTRQHVRRAIRDTEDARARPLRRLHRGSFFS